MDTRQHKSAIWIIVSGILGIILFLLFLAVLRYAAIYFANAFLAGFADFLFSNTGLIIFLGIMFMIADLFYSFSFPLNLPGPIFSAIGSIFLIAFLFHILGFIDDTYGFGIFPGLYIVEFFIYPIVFLIVLVAGYWSIFSSMADKERVVKEPTQEPAAGPEKKSSEVKNWDDIGDEFKEMLYDIFHRIREEIRQK